MTSSFGLPIALVLGLLFGVLLWFLSPLSVAVLIVAVVIGLNLLRRPLLGLLLFAAVATFLPYSTINIGVRTTVSELLILVIWGCVLFQGLFTEPDHAQRSGPTERYVLALILFSAFPFVVGQLMVQAEGNGVANWLRWMANMSLLFLVARLLRDGASRDWMVLALLLGTLAMLSLSLPIFLLERSAVAINPLLTKLGYATLAEVIGDTSEAIFMRMGSPWMHPNTLGGAMALVLPLALRSARNPVQYLPKAYVQDEAKSVDNEPNSPPTINGSSFTTIKCQAQKACQHTFEGTDPNLNDTLTLTIDFLPPQLSAANCTTSQNLIGNKKISCDLTGVSERQGTFKLLATLSDGTNPPVTKTFTLNVN